MGQIAWYALQTKAGWESKAQSGLDRSRIETWLPRSKIRTVRKTKSGPVICWPEVPHYPRYLFARMPINRLWLARKAKCSIVSLEEGYPSPIPDPVMALLMSAFDDTGLALPTQRQRFQAMQRVRFKDEEHAFYDQIVKVIEDNGADTITILMRLVGKEHHFKVPATDLEAA